MTKKCLDVCDPAYVNLSVFGGSTKFTICACMAADALLPVAAPTVPLEPLPCKCPYAKLNCTSASLSVAGLVLYTS